jgi:hypothetical protein
LGIDVVELGGLDQGVDGCGAAAAGVGSGEGPVVAADSNAAQRPLGGVVGHAQAAVVEEADQRLPGVEAVGDRLGDLVVGRQPGVLLAQPDAESLDPRPAAFVPALASLFAVLARFPSACGANILFTAPSPAKILNQGWERGRRGELRQWPDCWD